MSSLALNPPVSYSFRCQRTQQLTWTLVDSSGNPITGATVTATLYLDRSLEDPTLTPGTADSIFNDIPLIETNPGVSGIYVGSIPSSFNPQTPGQFVLFISAYDSGDNLLADWNFRAVVVPFGQPTDLVLLDDVKDWLGLSTANTDADNVLQILISGFSQYVLRRTGRTSFSQIENFTEIYDGNGAMRMFLHNSPIVSISSIIVGSYSIPQSTGLLVPGWFIEQSKKSIAIRVSNGYMPPQSIFPYEFRRGIGNIQVTYSAGYSSVPYDLYEATMEMIGILYSRKDWKDLASKALSISGSGSGTTTYRKEFLTPGVEEIIRSYSRRSILA